MLLAMSNTIRTLTILLSKDCDEEAATSWLQFLKGHKHIADVIPGDPVDVDNWIARDEARRTLGEGIRDLLK